MKLQIHISTFVLAVLFTFQACSPPGSDTLRLSSWVSSPSETALFKQTLAEFRELQPELEFKYEPIPGNYSEKLQTHARDQHGSRFVFSSKG